MFSEMETCLALLARAFFLARNEIVAGDEEKKENKINQESSTTAADLGMGFAPLGKGPSNERAHVKTDPTR
jgi:hypothetical protein